MTRPANAESPGGVRHCRVSEPSGWPSGDIAASWCIAQMQGQMHVHYLGSARWEAVGKQSGLLPVSHGTEVREAAAVFCV